MMMMREGVCVMFFPFDVTKKSEDKAVYCKYVEYCISTPSSTVAREVVPQTLRHRIPLMFYWFIGFKFYRPNDKSKEFGEVCQY
jgi:hypothetical protein